MGNEREESKRGGRSDSFSLYLHVLVPHSPPHALKVTGDLDKEERRAGRSGNDLGAGLTRFDGGINERPREEGFSVSLSPPIFGKTEVTRELD
jgi:hypothetical protein